MRVCRTTIICGQKHSQLPKMLHNYGKGLFLRLHLAQLYSFKFRVVLCGWVVCRKEVFMCSSLNLKCFTVELNCGMLFFQNAGTSKQQGSSTICKPLGVSLERRETPNTVSRGTSPSSTETSHNSAIISPLPPILSNTARMSPVPPSILPCTSSSRDKQIQYALDDNAVTLRSTRNKYTYKKISDLVEPERKVNIYGVIHTIAKVKLILNLAYIVCSY